MISQINDSEKLQIDFTSLWKALERFSLVSIFAFWAGYCFCRVFLGERKWRNSPREEKIIYSSVGGAFLAFIIWGLITIGKIINSDINTIINGSNEVSLIWIGLVIVSGIELIYIFADVIAKRWSRRKKRRFRINF